MTTHSHLDVAAFNDDGGVRNVPQAELDTLTQEQQTGLAILQRCGAEFREAAADHVASVQAVRGAVKAYDAIMVERDAAIPRLTHIDLLRAAGMHH